jgi:hypothetical protein
VEPFKAHALHPMKRLSNESRRTSSVSTAAAIYAALAKQEPRTASALTFDDESGNPSATQGATEWAFTRQLSPR